MSNVLTEKWLSNFFSFQWHSNLVWSPHNSAAALAVCAWKNTLSAYSFVSLVLKLEASIFLHVWFPLQHRSFVLDRLKLNQSPAKPMNDWQKAITSNSEGTFKISLHQCQSFTDPRKENCVRPEVLQREHMSVGCISTHHLSSSYRSFLDRSISACVEMRR